MERFWNKVKIRDPQQCWPWQAALTDAGYGVFWFDGKQHAAHRVAFFLTHNEWPADQVDHRCHNEDMSCNERRANCPHRRCVNPAHLVAATGSENQRARRTRCRKGHPYVTENVDYEVLANGTWTCLHCRTVNQARVAREGQRHRSTTCIRDHDLTDALNVYISPDGRRHCVPCRNLRQRVASPVSRSEAGRRGAAARWGEKH